jgi:hypothetical protein
MHHKFLMAVLAAGLLPMAAPAQSPARPDPLDPKAATPALHYRSALAAYRRPADAPASGWREANEAVERIGGWRAYAREAQAPAASAPTPPARAR